MTVELEIEMNKDLENKNKKNLPPSDISEKT